MNHQLAALMLAMDSALLGLSAHGTIVVGNPAAVQLFGMRAELMTGRRLAEVVVTEQPDDLLSVLEAVWQGQSVHRYETTCRSADQWVPIGLSLFPVKDANAEVVGACMIARDISEIKSAERDRERHGRLLALIRDAIVVCNAAGTITFWNHGAERTYGWSMDVALGQKLEDLLFLRFPQARETTMAALNRDGYWEGELIARCRDGRTSVSASQWALLRDESKGMTEILVISSDISRRKHEEMEIALALAQLREANDKLARMNKIKSDFVSVVSHEFRTALTGIQGFSQLMRDEDFSPGEMKQFSGDIYQDAKRLDRMVSEMLDLDRMESRRMSLNLEVVDLNVLIRATAGSTQLRSPKHPFDLRLDPKVPPMLIDRDKMHQVIINLFSNAVKYSPAGGRIIVTTHRRTDAVLVTIQDHGVGIPENVIDKVFEPYARFETEQTRYVQGTGIGLAVTRELVTLHGGAIWAESVLSVGSTFAFTIPASSSSPPIEGSYRPPSLLFAEDDETIQKLVRLALRGQSYDIHFASNGHEALAMMERLRPDVLFSDLSMPGLDGIQLIDAVRAMPHLADTTIVLITASVQRYQREEALTRDIAGFLHKPFDINDLRAVVERFGKARSEADR